MQAERQVSQAERLLVASRTTSVASRMTSVASRTTSVASRTTSVVSRTTSVGRTGPRSRSRPRGSTARAATAPNQRGEPAAVKLRSHERTGREAATTARSDGQRERKPCPHAHQLLRHHAPGRAVQQPEDLMTSSTGEGGTKEMRRRWTRQGLIISSVPEDLIMTNG